MNIKEMAINFAILEIGKGEEEKNNFGPDIEKYLNGLAEPPSNWCAGFISWCYLKASEELGILPPFKYSLSARALMNQFKVGGPVLKIVETPAPGDLAFWWRGARNSWMGHVGIVEKVENDLFFTIEGNIGIFPALVNRFYHPFTSENLLGFGGIKIDG